MKKFPKWRKTAVGGWVTTDGRWIIRGPIFGKKMYWIYGPYPKHSGRYTPTGRYDDCVSVSTVSEAKELVKTLYL